MSNPPPPSEAALPSVGDISVCQQYTMAASVAAERSTQAGAVGAAERLTQAGAVGAADAAVVTAVAADAAKDGDKKMKAVSSLVKANVASTKMPPCATKAKTPTPTEMVCFIVVFIHMKSYALTIL